MSLNELNRKGTQQQLMKQQANAESQVNAPTLWCVTVIICCLQYGHLVLIGHSEGAVAITTVWGWSTVLMFGKLEIYERLQPLGAKVEGVTSNRQNIG